MKFWGKNSRKVNSAVFTWERVLTASARLDFLDSSCCLLHICDAFYSVLKKYVSETGGDIGAPPAWLRPGLRSLGSVGVSRCCGTAMVIMRLLAADVALNLLSLPITPSCGHHCLLSSATPIACVLL